MLMQQDSGLSPAASSSSARKNAVSIRISSRHDTDGLGYTWIPKFNWLMQDIHADLRCQALHSIVDFVPVLLHHCYSYAPDALQLPSTAIMMH